MIYSFLLIGQSNMAGRGNLKEVAPVWDARLLMMRNARWQPLHEPVSSDRPMAGASLGVSFAKRFIEEHPGDSAALIPCADGGTTLQEWQKGEPLYEHAVFCARQAQRSSKLAAILWHQGEADMLPEQYSSYRIRFEQMTAALKKDIGADVPVLMGGLGEYLPYMIYDEKYKNYSFVNQQLIECAQNNPDYYYVSAKSLSCNSDMLHFSAKALREFGLRYYTAFSQKRSIFDEEIPESLFLPAAGESGFLKNMERLCKEYKAGRLSREAFENARAELVRNA